MVCPHSRIKCKFSNLVLCEHILRGWGVLMPTQPVYGSPPFPATADFRYSSTAVNHMTCNDGFSVNIFFGALHLHFLYLMRL